jgi:hypothetical protein
MGLLGNGFDDPRSAAVMALAGGLLQGNFGGGLLGANSAYAEQKNAAAKQQFMQMQMEAMRQENEQKKAAMEQAQRKQQALPGLFNGGVSAGAFAPSADGMGPTMPQSAAPPAGFDVQRALLAGYGPDEIAKLHGLTNLGRQKVARTVKGMGPDGKEYEYQVDEFGQRVGDGMAQYRAPISVNQGDRTTFADPYSLKPVGQFGMNMSPDARDASARGWAGLNETKRHNTVAEANAAAVAGAGRAPQGYRFRQDGSLEAIPGGPADRQSAATADERKSATLLQRLEGSQKQLQGALTANPGAAKPELFASGVRAIAGETAGNVVTGTQRQQVEAAQLDMLDAALTLGTGAAYTREQIESYRKSYFPQIGDDPPTVKDKQARLANILQAARIAAGRAGSQIPQGGASGGWSIQKVN